MGWTPWPLRRGRLWNQIADYAGDEKLLALMRRAIDTTLQTQEADGHIGLQPPGEQLWAWWDMQQLSFAARMD